MKRFLHLHHALLQAMCDMSHLLCLFFATAAIVSLADWETSWHPFVAMLSLTALFGCTRLYCHALLVRN